MRSIPLAITWELLRRGWYWLILAIIGANALPVVLLVGMKRVIASIPNDPSILVLQVVLMQVGMLVLGSAVFSIQGNPSRLYTFPVRNSTIVIWHLLPVMAIMFVESAASTALLNLAFGFDWPIWGPAMLLAVTLAAINAVQWLTEKSAWIVVGLLIVISVLGLWHSSRYGAIGRQPTHLWEQVTCGEALTMLGVAVGAYFVGLAAIARNRRGEPPLSTGFAAWFTRLLDLAPGRRDPFRSPEEAQFWFEWRQKGWAAPAVTIAGIVFAVGLWLCVSRRIEDLLEGFLAGGALLTLAGVIVGFIIGNCGTNDASFEMGQFRATRPMSSTAMAHINLMVAAKSIFIAWAIWLSGFVIALGFTLLVGSSQVNPEKVILLLPKGLLLLPATLVSPWLVQSLIASGAMTGRNRLIMGGLCSGITLFIGWMLVSKNITPSVARILDQSVIAVVGVLLVFASSVGIGQSRRRGLIDAKLVYVGLGGFLALCMYAAFILLPGILPASSPATITFIIGLAALAVAPLGVAPLALAWNRTR
jgi:hypothetical protein